MKKLTTLAVTLLFITGLAAAQTSMQEKETYFNSIKPDGAAYGLEVAAENVGTALRLMDREKVMEDRSLETKQMTREHGSNSEHTQRASEALGTTVSQIAKSDDEFGKEKAASILEELEKEGVPVGPGATAMQKHAPQQKLSDAVQQQAGGILQ